MSGTPEQDAVKATKEDSVISEAARVIGRHQARPLAEDPPLKTVKCTIQFGGLVAVNALDMSVEYARTREQFGAKIGTYQAIKHALADMLGLAECSTAAKI